MVKINDTLVSTSLRSPSTVVNNATVSDATVQMESNLEEQILRQMDRDKSAAKQEALRTQEMEYQSKSALSKINDGVQQASLNALATFAEIDYANYQAKEKEMASSFLLNKTAEAEFQLEQEYNKILSGAGPKGEGIMENTQSWINNKLLELENTAPNALAKSKLQEWGTNFKFKSLGKALQDTDKFRKDSSLREIEATVNLYSNALMVNPEGTNIDEKLKLIEGAYQASGFDTNTTKEQLNKIRNSLVESKIRGSINIGDFEAAKALYVTEAKSLDKGKATNILNMMRAAEETFLKSNLNKLFETDVQQKFMEGRLSSSDLSDPKVSKILDNQFKTTAMAAESLLENGDVGGYVNGITQLILQRPNLPLKAYDDYFKDALSSQNNPTKTISVAQIIRNLGDNPETLPVTESLSAYTKAKAEIISRRSPMVDPITAIKQADEIMALDKGKKDFLNDRFNTEVKDKAITGSDIVDKIGLNGWFSFAPESTPDLELDYNQSLKDYYTLTNGDFDMASELAVKDLKSTYRVSEINGKKEAVRYPVEYFFNGDDEIKAVKSHVETEVKKKFQSINIEDMTVQIADVNGVKVSKGFKILPIEGITNNQKSSDKVTFKIVNSAQGMGWDVIDVIDIPKNIYSQQKIKEAKNWVDAQIKVEERTKEEYAKLRNLTIAEKMQTSTLVGK